MAFTRMGTTKQRVHGIQFLGKCFIPHFQSGQQPDLLFAPIGLLQYIHNLVPAAAFRLVQIPEETVIPEYFACSSVIAGRCPFLTMESAMAL